MKPIKKLTQNLYTSISKSLLSTPNSTHLKKLHSQIITTGLHKSVFFTGTLISKYSQFKHPSSSLSLFTQTEFKTNTFLWNSVIRATTNNGLFSKSLELYFEMRKLDVKFDKYTFPSVIKSCGCLMEFGKGRFVHEHVRELGFESDLYVSNALIDMYGKCGELGFARKVFDEMFERDIVSWNSLMSGYSCNGLFSEGLELYWRLRNEGVVSDSFTFLSVFTACGGLGEVEEGEVVHGLVRKSGTVNDVLVCNGLLSMYFKFDMVVDCLRIFDEMVCRDAVTWNIVINGYFELGLCEETIGLFVEMVRCFKPDVLSVTSVLRACANVRDLESGKYVHDYMVNNGYEFDTLTSNILINMYAKCGDVSRSREVFERMKNKDLVSWNSLLNGYIEKRCYEEPMNLFKKMKIEMLPDSVTYVALLSVCKERMSIEFTESLHCDIIKQGFDSILVLGNTLLDAYSKCGRIDNSLKQFQMMKSHDIFSWNSIIAACTHSHNSIGLKMLSQMRLDGQLPDVPTFLSAVPLCTNLNAKRQAKELHGCTFKLGLESNTPISNSLIEMYSSTGSLKKSILVFDQMKARDVVSWTSLISAYGMHGEGKKALEAYEEMKATSIQPDETIFVAVIYACSHSGLVQEGRFCFEQIKKVHKIEPSLEHYAAIVDLYSRSGLLAEAEEFIVSMPMKPDVTIWGALLSASRARGDLVTAERVLQQMTALNVEDPGYRVLVSNVYAEMGKWDKVGSIRTSLRNGGVRKDPGCSWLEG